ncbi:MAG: translocation/assembly module TamB domain-containing protein [Pseudomonadota bacterium]
MPKIIWIPLAIVAVLLLVGITAVAGTLYSAPGRNFLGDVVETQIEAALGGDAKIGRIDGPLPGVVVVQDVSIADDQGVWLEVDRVELVWRPFALLSTKVDAETLKADTITLSRLPNLPEAPPTEETGVRIPQLPNSLPQISIADLSASALVLEEAVFGQRHQFSIDGSLDIGSAENAVDIKVLEQNNTDTVRISLGANSSDTTLNLTAGSIAGGLVSSLVGTDQPVSVLLDASGPGQELDYQLTARADTLLTANMKGALNLSESQSGRYAIAAIGDIVLLEGLSDIQSSIGDTVSVDVNAEAAPDQITLTIESIRTLLAAVSGDVIVNPSSDGLLETARLSLAVEPGERAPEILTEDITLLAELTPQNTDDTLFNLMSDISTKGVVVQLSDAITDLSDRFEGTVSASILDPERVLLQTDDGSDVDTGARYPKALSSKAFLSVIDRSKISVSDLSVTVDGETAVSGAAELDTETSGLSATLRLSVPQSIARLALADISFTDLIEGNLAVTGSTDVFSVSGNIANPNLAFGGGEIPAARTSIAFSGLPLAPSGRIASTTLSGEGQLRIEADTSDDGTISIPTLELSGSLFSLIGNAEMSGSMDDIKAAATYTGDPGATPFPGVGLAGDMAISVNASQSDDTISLQTESSRLTVNQIDASDLKLSVLGALSDAAVNLEISTIRASDSMTISALSGTANARLTDDIVISLTKLDAALNGERYAVTEPATIALSNGLSVSNLRVSQGANGKLSVDAIYAPSLWQADIALASFVPPGAPTIIDGAITLDTNQTLPLVGNLVATPIFSAADDIALGLKTSWDGETLRVVDDERLESFSLDISVPLLLQKLASVSATLGDTMSGTFNYDGPIATLAQLAPPEFQSIEGDLDISASVEGAIAQPVINGSATFRDGRYSEPQLDLGIENITLDATASSSFEGTKVSFDAGASGAGQEQQSIFLKGDVALADSSSVNIALRLDDARLSAQMLDRLDASGDIVVAGSLEELEATGDIFIDAMTVTVAAPTTAGFTAVEIVEAGESPSSNGQPIGLSTNDTRPTKAQTENGIDLDIKIRAPQQLFVNGLGLTSEWEADLNVVGTSTAPIVLGTIDIRRGTLDFAGRRFDLSTGQLAFDRLQTNNPRIDITAQYETPSDVLASLNASGRAMSPDINLSSTPSLPQEDIMAIVLFGKPAQELTAFESLQIAQTLAQLSGAGPFGGGGFNPVSSAQSALGLDMMNVDFDNPSGSQSLTVGKYVADGLFVSATQSARGDEGAVRVEYELTNAFTVETELRQDGDQVVSANWKVDF